MTASRVRAAIAAVVVVGLVALAPATSSQVVPFTDIERQFEDFA